MTLSERVKSWSSGARILSDWLGSGQKVVEKEQAQARADICIKCPQNKTGSLVTKAVAWSIKEQTDLKSDLGLAVAGEKSLKTCAVCTCWLRLKIWIPMEKLKAEETPESLAKYPDFCWMRTES